MLLQSLMSKYAKADRTSFDADPDSDNHTTDDDEPQVELR